MSTELNLPCTVDPGGLFLGNGAIRFVWDGIDKIDGVFIRDSTIHDRRYWTLPGKTQASSFDVTVNVKVNTHGTGSISRFGYLLSTQPSNNINFIGFYIYYGGSTLPYTPATPFSITPMISDDLGQLDEDLAFTPLPVAYLTTWLKVNLVYDGVTGTLTQKVYDSLDNLLQTRVVVLTPGRTFATDSWGMGNPDIIFWTGATMNTSIKNILASIPGGMTIKSATIKNTVARAI